MIYAGTKGWVDTSRSSEVRRFEAELLAFFRAQHADLLGPDPRHRRAARRPTRLDAALTLLPRRLRHRGRSGTEPWQAARSASFGGGSAASSRRARSRRRWSSSPLPDRPRAGADRRHRPTATGWRGSSWRPQPGDPAAAASCSARPRTSAARGPRRHRRRPRPLGPVQLVGPARRRAELAPSSAQTGARRVRRRGRPEGRRLLPLPRHRRRARASRVRGPPDLRGRARVAAVGGRAVRDGEVDQVELVSTRFRSAASQSVEARQLLPLPEPDDAAACTEAPSGARGLHRVRARGRDAPRASSRPRRSRPRSSPRCSRAPRPAHAASSARWPPRPRTPTSWSARSPA